MGFINQPISGGGQILGLVKKWGGTAIYGHVNEKNKDKHGQTKDGIQLGVYCRLSSLKRSSHGLIFHPLI